MTRLEVRRRRTGLIAALAADVAGIVVFASVGRRSHDESDGLGAVLSTAAPFLVALALGWTLFVALGRLRSRPADPRHVDAGVIVWLVTVAVGLLLRRTLWDRGTAVAFVIVATAFLGVVIVGWRVCYDRVRRSRSPA